MLPYVMFLYTDKETEAQRCEGSLSRAPGCKVRALACPARLSDLGTWVSPHLRVLLATSH